MVSVRGGALSHSRPPGGARGSSTLTVHAHAGGFYGENVRARLLQDLHEDSVNGYKASGQTRRRRRRRLTVATTSFRAWKPDSTGKTCSVPSAISASCRHKLGLVLRVSGGRSATGAELGGSSRLVGQLSCPSSDGSRKLVRRYHIKTGVMVSSHSREHPTINGAQAHWKPDWGAQTQLCRSGLVILGHRG